MEPRSENTMRRDASRNDSARPATPEQDRPLGVLAEFETPTDLLRAAEQIRAAGYRRWDAHTPFPIHGLERAMGIKDTGLGWIVFVCGTTGCLFGVWMQWWMNAIDYPIVISGKPLWSLPANVPVIFELTILFSAVSAFFGMFVLNGLPKLYHWVFFDERFEGATDNRYFISVDSSDPKFDSTDTQALLEALGSIGARTVTQADDLGQ